MATNPNFSAHDLIPFARPEALTEPEKLLAAYFSSSSVGLCILDTELRYLALNQALAEFHGVPVSDHLGKTLREILGDIAADRIEPQFQRVLATREPVNYVLSATLSAKKEVGHWIAHYLPIQDASGVVTRIGVVVVEITAQKKLEESLKDVGGKLRRATSTPASNCTIPTPDSWSAKSKTFPWEEDCSHPFPSVPTTVPLAALCANAHL
ncbi:MAG: PAS domain-containing protein [Candidatus Sulfotelmatobacter sp.]